MGTKTNPVGDTLAVAAGGALAPVGTPAAGVAPVVKRIVPAGRWFTWNLKELADYRELLYFLVWREIKVRYKQTIIGAG